MKEFISNKKTIIRLGVSALLILMIAILVYLFIQKPVANDPIGVVIGYFDNSDSNQSSEIDYSGKIDIPLSDYRICNYLFFISSNPILESNQSTISSIDDGEYVLLMQDLVSVSGYLESSRLTNDSIIENITDINSEIYEIRKGSAELQQVLSDPISNLENIDPVICSTSEYVNIDSIDDSSNIFGILELKEKSNSAIFEPSELSITDSRAVSEGEISYLVLRYSIDDNSIETFQDEVVVELKSGIFNRYWEVVDYSSKYKSYNLISDDKQTANLQLAELINSHKY